MPFVIRMPGGDRDSTVGEGDAPLCAPLDQLPSAALAAGHAALCSLPHPRDAAAFRCTCRTVHDEVLLPEKLELSFPTPPQPSTLHLGQLLRLPQAAHTQLCISIADWGPFPENEEEDRGDWGLWPTCEVLGEAGEKLSDLSFPCTSIGSSLCAVRERLPHVNSLVLRINNDTDADALDDTDPDSEEQGVFSVSQLTSLTLQAPPGIPPISLFDYDAEIPLQLHRYPGLKHLVLVGPIVCEPGQPPFLLPADTKVTIDPGLGDRPPTEWARTPVSYARFADMPEDAVPSWDKYREEDAERRLQRLGAFTQDLIDFAVARKHDYVSYRGGGQMFKDYPGSLIRAFLEGYCGVPSGNFAAVASIAEIICSGRSDLLWERVNRTVLSESCLWEVEVFVRGLK